MILDMCRSILVDLCRACSINITLVLVTILNPQQGADDLVGTEVYGCTFYKFMAIFPLNLCVNRKKFMVIFSLNLCTSLLTVCGKYFLQSQSWNKQNFSIKRSAWKGFISCWQWKSPSPKQILGPKKCCVQKNYGSEEILSLKLLVPKKLWIQKFLGLN